MTELLDMVLRIIIAIAWIVGLLAGVAWYRSVVD